MATSPRAKVGTQTPSEAMSTNNQWDVNKALTLASLFHFLYGAGNACAIPFLTLYFRQLGLTAPLVGIIIGLKHLITSLWAPLCSYLAKTHNKRKVFISGSLFCSVGAGLLLTLIPPVNKDIVYKYCNMSQHPTKQLTTTQVPDINVSHLSAVNGNSFADNKMWSTKPLGMISKGQVSTRKPTVMYTSFKIKSTKTPLINKDANDVDINAQQFIDASPGVTSGISGEDVVPAEQNLEKTTVNVPLKETAGIMIMKENADKNDSRGNSNFTFYAIPLPVTEVSYVRKNLSGRRERAQDISSQLLQGTDFLDSEHQVFLMVLGAVVFWELLAGPLEWMVDDSLYEYLDFVDAADRYENLWIWSYLGASLGVCSTAIFVDQLNCFLNTNIPRFAVHFYGYALFMTLTLVASTFFPIYVSKKTEHVNKTVKALNLIGSDGRTILYAVTVFLTGAIGSTVQNFLFWQMQDQGSHELFMGLSVTIGLMAEILLYIFKSKLLKALSNGGTVALGLSCLAVQLLYYSFLWNSWAVLPIQVFCAFSNGALWWAVYVLTDDIATPGTERSLHSVLQGLSHGCGASLGSFAGGFGVSNFGLAMLYRACSVTLILWLVLFLVVQSKLPRQKRINYSRLLAADSSDMSDSDYDEEKERDWLVKAMKDDNFTRNW
ncbi:major facilitator superfamily domain-containing protein 6-like [Protobothrops mucrosquamatus]|uniref:major facilitator superfamily domain-containing protein 6-like n=1 Tax=Protobothrops mucrosquamatus TaxID=103944 RepID=UPI000775E5BF|nr:major facilitator superfamily domain-containing protein 6-like [Protobothrops mucrosquamatus]